MKATVEYYNELLQERDRLDRLLVEIRREIDKVRRHLPRPANGQRIIYRTWKRNRSIEVEACFQVADPLAPANSRRKNDHLILDDGTTISFRNISPLGELLWKPSDTNHPKPLKGTEE